MSLSSGTKLGVYEILSPLGAGGMGEVYRARDSKLQRDVALKVLPDTMARDAQRMARFEREARIRQASSLIVTFSAEMYIRSEGEAEGEGNQERALEGKRALLEIETAQI